MVGTEGDIVRERMLARGRVQGVGFRWHVRRSAEALGLSGWVRNLPGGEVQLEAQGPRAAVGLLAGAVGRGPAMARVDSLAREEIPPAWNETGFSISG
jgi:acylphosphatase